MLRLRRGSCASRPPGALRAGDRQPAVGGGGVETTNSCSLGGSPAASSGPAALKSAVGTFVHDLESPGSSGYNVSKLTSDANAIGAACASQSAPGGAPGTGGGSTSSAADPALYGVGGAVVLAGIGALGIGSRRRRGANQGS